MSGPDLRLVADRALGGWVGPALVLCLAAWPFLAHGVSVQTVGFASAMLVALVAWAGGRLLTAVHPAAVGIGTAVVIGAAMLPVVLTGTLDSVAGPPLGYANANAALLTAAVAGLVAIWPYATFSGMTLWLMAAPMGFTIAAIFTRSVSAAVSCVLLLGVGRFLGRGRGVAWQAASTGLLVIGFTATVGVGLMHRGTSTPAALRTVVGQVRPTLWSDALAAAQSHPIAGVGPGHFPQFSVLGKDPDTAWAHSMPLQVLAETGFVGFALLVSVVAWLVWRLGRASALLAVLAVQPMVDYVLHVPAVLISFAFLLGGASLLFGDTPRAERPPRSRESDRPR